MTNNRWTMKAFTPAWTTLSPLTRKTYPVSTIQTSQRRPPLTMRLCKGQWTKLHLKASVKFNSMVSARWARISRSSQRCPKMFTSLQIISRVLNKRWNKLKSRRISKIWPRLISLAMDRRQHTRQFLDQNSRKVTLQRMAWESKKQAVRTIQTRAICRSRLMVSKTNSKIKSKDTCMMTTWWPLLTWPSCLARGSTSQAWWHKRTRKASGARRMVDLIKTSVWIQMHRMMMKSLIYRRSSSITPELNKNRKTNYRISKHLVSLIIFSMFRATQRFILMLLLHLTTPKVKLKTTIRAFLSFRCKIRWRLMIWKRTTINWKRPMKLSLYRKRQALTTVRWRGTLITQLTNQTKSISQGTIWWRVRSRSRLHRSALITTTSKWMLRCQVRKDSQSWKRSSSATPTERAIGTVRKLSRPKANKTAAKPAPSSE